MSNFNEVFERYKTNLAGVNGACVQTTTKELGKTIADLFAAQGLKSVCVAETPLMKEAGVVDALKAAGVEVFTDHIRLHAETAKGGIAEAAYGVIDLGSMIQKGDDVDARIVATMSEDFFGIVKASTFVEDYDAMFDILATWKDFPNFVGFITGPSRTADIECVSTVGVHGPLRLTAIVLEDA